jgi:hypothetical protein
MKALTEEQRSGFWMWLPITLFLPIVAVVLLASAAVEFAR